MRHLLDAGQALRRNAELFPDKIAVRDLGRSLTFLAWNNRAARLANAFTGLGLCPGDKVAVLAYNRLEWLEIYGGLAKAGLVAVPVNFRLVSREVAYILADSGARALIVEGSLTHLVEEIRPDIDGVLLVRLGNGPPVAGFHDYEDLLAAASDRDPERGPGPDDIAEILYTSGTTGHPKGAMRSHRSEAVLSLMIAAGFGFTREETGLLVMPLCHANSLWFGLSLASLGATVVVYDRPSFDPELLLEVLSENRITFTSLVPTHYVMTLGLPEATKARHDVGHVRRLLISSAPARRDTKLAILDTFRNTGLFEGYGATEAGWVTLLAPEEQLSHLGSIGREWPGTDAVRLLDPDGRPVGPGEVGEIYFNSPAVFSGYLNLPDKTAECFRGDWCTVGDMARRDEDGYYHLADRRSNLIISGGENVYPMEVEDVLGAHEMIGDVAVIGLPDETWGEAVHAVVVLKPGADASGEEIIAFARERLAGYKRPRGVTFIEPEEMPRTATGKIQHRILRDRLARR